MGNARPIDGRPQSEVQVRPDKLEVVASICYLGDMLSACGGCEMAVTGFIRVREMSGKLKKNQGQGIVREFYVVSGKNECLLKCQGNVREFYNFQFVSNDEKQKKG